MPAFLVSGLAQWLIPSVPPLQQQVALLEEEDSAEAVGEVAEEEAEKQDKKRKNSNSLNSFAHNIMVSSNYKETRDSSTVTSATRSLIKLPSF